MGRRGRIQNSGVTLVVFVVLRLVSCTQNLPIFNIDSGAVSLQNGIYYRDAKPFTGRLYKLNEQADTVFLGDYQNGQEHGLQKTWYSKGRLQTVRLFSKGEKEGRHTGFWENGNRRFDYQFERDLFAGIQKEWYANGRLFKQTHYRAGYEQGMQQVWDSDGAIIANYEARNGRNYGNIGRKNCKSVWKDDSVRVASN